MPPPVRRSLFGMSPSRISGAILVLMAAGVIGLGSLADGAVRSLEPAWQEIQAHPLEMEGGGGTAPPDGTVNRGVDPMGPELARTRRSIWMLVVGLLMVGALWVRVFGRFGSVVDIPVRDQDESISCDEPVSCEDIVSIYQTVVESGVQAIIIHENFKPLFVNPVFATMFGFDRVEDVMAMDSVLELVDEGIRDDVATMHPRIAAGEVGVWWGRLHTRKRDGTLFWIEETVRPFVWHNRPVVLASLLDITDRVRSEQDYDMKRSQTERQAEDLVTMAEELSSALTLAEQQKEQLHQLSVSDPLTGVYNRRHFMDMLQAEMARKARQASRRVSVMILDLDHFKAVNDTHGHGAGDETLRRFAQQCEDTLRETDVFGRWGGEEFAVLLPGAGLDEAVAVAERLCRRTREIRIPAGDGTTFGVTVSVGVAEVQDPLAPLDETLSRADAALYASKAAGRDRVTADAHLPSAAKGEAGTSAGSGG